MLSYIECDPPELLCRQLIVMIMNVKGLDRTMKSKIISVTLPLMLLFVLYHCLFNDD